MQAFKFGLFLCWLHVLTLFQKLLAKFRQFIIACTDEPDFVDVIVFNDMPLKCYQRHKNVNCPRKYCQHCRVNKLISYINNAKVCMDIAHLVFTSQKIYDAVLAAWYRGVNIRFVTDSEMLHVHGSKIRKLCSHNIPIHVAAQKTLMHHKFAIIDGEQRILQLDSKERKKAARVLKRRGIVMTGSLNWTIQGTQNNFENVVITSNRKVNARYQLIFDNLYNVYEELKIIFNEYEPNEIVRIPDKSAKNYF
ncbi:hypothetical protein KR200_009699 [Drosophila serrata]|nr:hypothetical protein KR200_009699 [Drosophila serrata]